MMNIFAALSALATCLVFQLPQASPVVETKIDLKFLAGSYVQGDGFVNTSLRIDPNGHFSYHWHADDGGSHRENGKVEIVDGFLILHTEKVETNRKPDALTHPKYRPVRWGDRLYLISDEQMANFCNMVNLGLEPRRRGYGQEFMRITATENSRKGEEEPKLGEIQGQPRVPAEWEKHLLKRPVEGKILEGLDDRCARIDLGSNDGLVKGMELLVASGKPEAPKEVAIVVVVEVRAKDCNVKAKLRPRGIDRFEKGQNVYSKIPASCMQMVRNWLPLFW